MQDECLVMVVLRLVHHVERQSVVPKCEQGFEITCVNASNSNLMLAGRIYSTTSDIEKRRGWKQGRHTLTQTMWCGHHPTHAQNYTTLLMKAIDSFLGLVMTHQHAQGARRRQSQLFKTIGHPALVDLIAWKGLAVWSENVAISIKWRRVRQTELREVSKWLSKIPKKILQTITTGPNSVIS